ncbi:MAG: protein-glutamate O-methyltransferase [Hyphomicrobiaceae bacterium]|nr:protein-glutamate O-methyltransferase [Hyphomicrobiaceae bacterium]
MDWRHDQTGAATPASAPRRVSAVSAVGRETPEHDALPHGPQLSDAQFQFFGRIAYDHAGIVIADFKRSMVLRRVLRRVKALDLKSIEEYCRLIAGPAGDAEIEQLINVFTTNKTSFFREGHHFDHLRNVALPDLLRRKRAEHSTRLRMWSAGCSTGEEAWSIAMCAMDVVTASTGAPYGMWDLKILATDIDTEVIAKAKSACYETADIAPLSSTLQARYLRPATSGAGAFEVAPDLKRLVTFKPLNLHDDWPFNGPFDIIFCRNVVIYFDRPAQRQLFDRFAGMLSESGLLYCGHSESLHSLSDRFRPVGRSVYERIA